MAVADAVDSRKRCLACSRRESARPSVMIAGRVGSVICPRKTEITRTLFAAARLAPSKRWFEVRTWLANAPGFVSVALEG